MQIKIDKISGLPRESDELNKLNNKITVIDDFSQTNNQWIKMGSYTYASISPVISNGKLFLDNLGQNYNIAALKNRKSCGRNSITSVDFVGGTPGAASQTHRIHCRETQNNYGAASFVKNTGQVTLLKVIDNTSTNLAFAIPAAFDTTKTYRNVFKCYENHLSTLLFDNTGKIVASAAISDDNIATLAGFNNGLCGGGIGLYDNYKFQNLDGFINVVCLGDSETSGYGLNFEQSYSNVLNTIFQDSPIHFNNQGVTGYTCASISSNLATLLTRYKTNYAKNICILQVGTNDIAGGLSAADTFTAWNSLSDSIIAAGFELWACTITARNGETTNNTNIKAFNDLLKQSAKPKILFDLWSEMINPADDNNNRSGYVQADGRHYTLSANTIWANLVKTEILNIYPALSSEVGKFNQIFVNKIASKSAHPTNYKPVFQDTDTKELYIYTGS